MSPIIPGPTNAERLRILRQSQHDTDRPGPIIGEEPEDAAEHALRCLKAAEGKRQATELHLATELDRHGDAAQKLSLTVERLERSVERLETIVSDVQGERLETHKRLDEHSDRLAQLTKQSANFRYWLMAALAAAEMFRESGVSKAIGAIMKAIAGG